MDPTDNLCSTCDQLGTAAVAWGHRTQATAPRDAQGPLTHGKTVSESEPPDTSLINTLQRKKVRHGQAELLTQVTQVGGGWGTPHSALGPSPVRMGQSGRWPCIALKDGRNCQVGGGRRSRGGNSRNPAGYKVPGEGREQGESAGKAHKEDGRSGQPLD